MGDQVTSPADVEKVLEAADRLGEHPTPAEGLAFTIIDSLDPEMRARMGELLDRLDNNAE